MKKINSEIIFVVVLISVATFSRLIPHPWNFTALGAVALLSGHLLKRQYLGLVVALLSLVISDLVLGFHNLIAWVYIPLLMSVALGYFIRSGHSIGENNTALNYFKSSVLLRNLSLVFSSSFLFFIVSNFGVWIQGTFYAKSFSGLVECYIMALPFLKNQLAGDLIYSVVLFGAYQMAVNFLKQRQADLGAQS
jgi:hypothetical protein